MDYRSFQAWLARGYQERSHDRFPGQQYTGYAYVTTNTTFKNIATIYQARLALRMSSLPIFLNGPVGAVYLRQR